MMKLRQLTLLDPRVPEWGQEHVLHRDCPICGSTGEALPYIRPDRLGLNQCLECGTIYVNPAPNAERLSQFYARYDADHRIASPLTPEAARHIFDRLDPLADVRISKLNSWGSLTGKRVLDVGFGRGQFLYLLQRLGAEAHGIELDPDAVAFARNLGLQCTELGSLDSHRHDGQFDIVAMNDLVEHPLNPLEMLQQACAALRPGGLLMVWTPNGAACLDHIEPVTFRVDLEHMQYLTDTSVQHLAETLQMHIAHLETLGFPALNQFDERGSSLSIVQTCWRLLKNSIIGRQLKSVARNMMRRHRPLISDSRAGRYHLFFVLRKPAR